MKITKAIIPVAGLGTRLLPATKSIPKEMLPIFDKPLIQYVVEEAIVAGIQEIILVTRDGKSAIEKHFNQDVELEALLEKNGKNNLLSLIRSIASKKVSIVSVVQHEAKGLGHAILCAKSLIGESPFAVLLPDVLIDEYYCNPSQDNLAAMIRNFHHTFRSQVMVEKVCMDKIDQYGVVDCRGVQLSPRKNQLISQIVEKPNKKDAPSNLSVVGRYVFCSEIWKCLENVKPDHSGEIQLTSAIANLIQQETVEAYCIVGKSHDCGNKFGYSVANLEYALRDRSVGIMLEKYIRDGTFLKHDYVCVVNG